MLRSGVLIVVRFQLTAICIGLVWVSTIPVYKYWAMVAMFLSRCFLRGGLFSLEWAFGGHPYDFSGVFKTAPFKPHPTRNLNLRSSVFLGKCVRSKREINHIIRVMMQSWTGISYHLLLRFVTSHGHRLCYSSYNIPLTETAIISPRSLYIFLLENKSILIG